MTATAGRDWRVDAACRGWDTELFFPTPGAPQRLYALVLDICAGCPVTAECHAEITSLPIRHRHGIWAGTNWTARQRGEVAS